MFWHDCKYSHQTKDGIATVQMLGLQLDNPNAGQKHRKKVRGEEDVLVYIERSEENLRKGAVRRQFPIKLAYACTAHKVQGMTMQSAVVSLKKIFEPEWPTLPSAERLLYMDYTLRTSKTRRYMLILQSQPLCKA